VQSWSGYERPPRVSSHKLNTKASGVIALAVMCSRVLGLVREVLFSALLGSERLGAFIVAFRIPNLLRDLFAEGALSTAFVTVFSKKLETEGEQSAWALAAKMFTLVTVFMSAVTILGILVAGPLFDVIALNARPEVREWRGLIVLLTQTMFPFILLVSLAALVMGMLNAKNVFGVPAMASSFFNIGSIAGGAALAWWLEPDFVRGAFNLWHSHSEELPGLPFGQRALLGLAIGTLVGGGLQFLIQLPSLRRAGFTFRPDFRWKDPGVSKILSLMVPSVIAASAVQVNVLVNTSFALDVDLGAAAWLNNAFRLMQLPIGIFGVAVATITLPVVSRIAAGEDRSAFGPVLGQALRLAAFLTIPAAAGLWVLAEPIIALIYRYGHFTDHASLMTSAALKFYAVGLIGYAGVKVLAPPFYAIDRKWTPMFVSFACIALNIGLNYVLVRRLGYDHRALAFSTTISAVLNFSVLYFLMRQSARMETLRLVTTIAKCAISAAAMAAVCWLLLTTIPEAFLSASFPVRLGAVLGSILLSGGIYFVLCWIFRVEAMNDAIAAVRRRLRR
jgi:integral membrane protein MviN